MRTLITFAALFISALLVQLGSGTLGPLDALAGSVRRSAIRAPSPPPRPLGP
jgi:hypothetical protein